MDAKKQTERRYLELVRREITDFPGGAIVPDEPPDFLVQSDATVIGIEITRIFADSCGQSPLPQSQDTERDLVAECAQKLAITHDLPPMMVDVYFSSTSVLRRRDRNDLATSVVRTLEKSVANEQPRPTITNNRPDVSSIPQIDAVSVWQLATLKSHLWQTGDAGIVNENFAPQLQNLIAGKEPKLDTYLNKCNECWLVVVADWRGPSAFFQMSNEMSDMTYSSKFDRVYFVDAALGQVTQLKLTECAR